MNKSNRIRMHLKYNKMYIYISFWLLKGRNIILKDADSLYKNCSNFSRDLL